MPTFDHYVVQNRGSHVSPRIYLLYTIHHNHDGFSQKKVGIVIAISMGKILDSFSLLQLLVKPRIMELRSGIPCPIILSGD